MLSDQDKSNQVAHPSDDVRHRAETTICECGWDIIYYPDAVTPVWIHMATGRRPCGVDELRRPWSAP
jgi:hypothetical protein